jgi:hypothetical protein
VARPFRRPSQQATPLTGKPDSLGESMMATVEAVELYSATLTGLRTQFINQGWSDEGAEKAVLIMLQQAGAGGL